MKGPSGTDHRSNATTDDGTSVAFAGEFTGDTALPLCVSGLALCIVWVAHAGLGLEGEAREWADYVALGCAFPPLILFASMTWRGRYGTAAHGLLTWVLTTVCVVASTRFVVNAGRLALLPAAVGELLIVFVAARLWTSVAGCWRTLTGPAVALTAAFVAVISWTVIGAMTLEFHELSESMQRFLLMDPAAQRVLTLWPASHDPGPSLPQFLVSSPRTLLVFTTSLLLVLRMVMVTAPRRSIPRRWAADAAALAVLGLASLRSDALSAGMAQWHAQFLVGPVEMVRQGGWLLWDTPSHYGFLNILTASVMPGQYAWQSLFLLNAILLWVVAGILYFLLRRRGGGGFVVPLAVTLAAVFLLPGVSRGRTGPLITPAVGPLRFFWCYVLLAVLVWEFHGATERRGAPLVLLAGCVAWLAGTLWSAESAVYCAVIWLPAFVLIVGWNRAPAGRTPWHVLGWLSLPPGLLTAAAVGLHAYYGHHLGHAPDWSGFIEYVVAFRGGEGAIPIDLAGAVWVLVLVFCALGTAVVRFARDGLGHPALPMLCGAWGAVFATASYVVGRSHEVNVSNLMPILCTAVAVLFRAIGGTGRGEAWESLVQLSLAPLLVVILTLTFGNGSPLAMPLLPLRSSYTWNVEKRLAPMDVSLAELLSSAGVKPTDPIVCADGLLGIWPTSEDDADGRRLATRTWAPTRPLSALSPLSEDRRRTYWARFTGRARLGGWLVEQKPVDALRRTRPWFHQFIGTTHVPTATHQNASWILTRYDFRGPD